MNIQTQAGGAVEAARSLLAFAGARILVEPGDLRMIESASDLQRGEPPQKGIGWISVFERWWPVYALSFDLAPVVDEEAANRPICVVLGVGDNLFGLLCDEVRVAGGAGADLRPLPCSLASAGSPVRDLAADSTGLICGTDAARLARFIGEAMGLNQADRAAGEGR